MPSLASSAAHALFCNTSRHPKAPTPPWAPSCKLLNENVDCLEKYFLGKTLGTWYLLWDMHHSRSCTVHPTTSTCTLMPAHKQSISHPQSHTTFTTKSDSKKGIIEAVPAGDPTERCSWMLVVPKKDGRSRRIVDFQKLNRVNMRETHHTRPSLISLLVAKAYL